jgi:hypothetical protein
MAESKVLFVKMYHDAKIIQVSCTRAAQEDNVVIAYDSSDKPLARFAGGVEKWWVEEKPS